MTELPQKLDLRSHDIAEDNRQDSGGRGVKGSEMTDRALPENSADAIDHVVRR